jgi:hypothetical protein
MTSLTINPSDDIQNAINSLKPGDTLVCADGLYHGGISIDENIKGNSSNQITIKAKNKWKAVIVGCGPISKHGISVSGQYINFDGLQILGALGDGVKFQASADPKKADLATNNTITNCWIHHNLSNGIGGHFESVPTMNLSINNCIIEFNGSHPAYDHGIYISGSGLKIKNCIIRSNAGWGIHCFGGYLSNAILVNNAVYLNGGFANCGGVLLRCPEGGGNITVINNTIVTNRAHPLMIEDAGSGGPSWIRIINNIIVSESEQQPLVVSSKVANCIFGKNAGSAVCLGIEPMAYDWRTYFVPNPEKGTLWLREFLAAIGPSVINPLMTGGESSYYDSETDRDFWGNLRTTSPCRGAFAFQRLLDVAPDSDLRKGWRGGDLYSFSNTAASLLVPDMWKLPPVLIGVDWK